MSELARWAFALCVGVAAGCVWWLLTYVFDFLVFLLSLLVKHVRSVTR